MTLGPYGLWFNRNETGRRKPSPGLLTWRAAPISCSRPLFGDVAYFYGEEGPLTAVFGWKAQQDAPDGYGFDFVNSDVLLHHMSFKEGGL